MAGPVLIREGDTTSGCKLHAALEVVDQNTKRRRGA